MLLKAFWPKKLRKRINGHSASWAIERTALPVYHDFRHKLDDELSRVRRFGHPLSICVLRSNGNGSVPDKPVKNNFNAGPQRAIYRQDNDIAPISEVEFILCGAIFKNCIRKIDIIVYDNRQHQFIMFFLETKKNQANHTIDRIKKLIGNRMARHLTYGIAEFPENGLILEDLIEHAGLACNKQTGDSLLQVKANAFP